MSKLESLKSLLELQIYKGFDIELQYSHLEITKKEEEELIKIIKDSNNYWEAQTISVDAMSYDMLIVATNKNNTEE